MIHDYTHIYGIWFLPREDGKSDFLANIILHEGTWKLNYRFRYYNPASVDPHDDEDEKSNWVVCGKDGSTETRDKLVATLRTVLMQMILAGYADIPVDHIHLDCPRNDPKVFEELRKKEWAHIREEPIDPEVN